MHINTRSLTKNLDHVNEIIAELDKNPDIIAISETKLKMELFPMLTLQAMTSFATTPKPMQEV